MLSQGAGNDSFHLSGGLLGSLVQLGDGDDSAALSNAGAANLAALSCFDGGAGSDRLLLVSTQLDGVARLHNLENIAVTQGSRLGLDSDYSGSGRLLLQSVLGVAASAEFGYPFARRGNLEVEPQAQLVWQHLDFESTRDRFSSIDFEDSNPLSARLGVSLRTPSAQVRPYLKIDFWQDFGGDDSVRFGSSAPVETRRRSSTAELAGGVTVDLHSALSLYATASHAENLDSNHAQALTGVIGMRLSG